MSHPTAHQLAEVLSPERQHCGSHSAWSLRAMLARALAWLLRRPRSASAFKEARHALRDVQAQIGDAPDRPVVPDAQRAALEADIAGTATPVTQDRPEPPAAASWSAAAALRPARVPGVDELIPTREERERRDHSPATWRWWLERGPDAFRRGQRTAGAAALARLAPVVEYVASIAMDSRGALVVHLENVDADEVAAALLRVVRARVLDEVTVRPHRRGDDWVCAGRIGDTHVDLAAHPLLMPPTDDAAHTPAGGAR